MVDAMVRADPGRFGHLNRYRYCKYCAPMPRIEVEKWRQKEKEELLQLERNRVFHVEQVGPTRKPRQS